MKTNIPNNDFSKESLKKQFRLSEFLAEKIISSVAYTSIAIIVLIFVFVFKEALPIFNFRKASKAKTEISNNNNLKPETYGAETTEVLKPEVYGTETTSETATLKPETYGDVVANEAQPTEEIRESENQGADNTWSSFLTTEWVPVSDNPRFGLIALLLGTLKVTIIAMLFAGPLGVLAALYTSAFASKKAKEIIKPLIELLAAFPSVVIGFFALMILATFFQDVFGYETRLNAFVGGVAMALAAIPIIYTIS
ncbi:PstC family ABC transporter permease, partial [Flavobacterium psychrophilum]